MKRKSQSAGGDEALASLALQAHQISGMLDPSVPIQALMKRVDDKPTLSRQPPKYFGISKLNDPELSRIINDRLAPGSLN